MNITAEMIRQIAESKFPGDPEKIEKYVREFNPSDPACIEDEKRFAEEAGMNQQLSDARQRFRAEDYFIRKLVYDFYTGEIHAYLFAGADPVAQKRRAVELMKGDPQEQKMAEWIQAGFSDRPIPLQQEKKQRYAEAVNEFSEKYGVHLDAENVASAVREIAYDKESQKEKFRQYFKCMFASAYCRLDEEKKARIDDLCADFNKVMMLALNEHTGVGEVPAMHGNEFAFGGMEKEEVKDYLLSFRESANDLTKQAQNEQKKEKDPSAAAKNQVREILAGNESREEKLARGTAQLQALELRHANRPKTFFLTSPLQNYRERKAISDIRKMMVEFSGSRNEVDELSRRKTIYRPGFAKEKERITAFCEKTVNNFDLETFLASEDLDFESLPEKEELLPDAEPVFTDNTPFRESRESYALPTESMILEQEKTGESKEKTELQEELYGMEAAPVLQREKPTGKEN